MIKEEWVEINGYRISNYGKVIGKKGYELSTRPSKDGYVSTSINIGEHYGKVHGMHRIIATIFIPNPENLPEVNHIDGDKSNNRVDNLEWVTKSENQNHACYVLKKKTGENNYNSKFTNEEIYKIYNLCKEGKIKYKDIAKMYNVDPVCISNIACGNKYRYLGLEPLRKKDKPVVGVSIEIGDIKRYKSARFAVEDGFTIEGISGCCTGKIKTHKGYIWKYDIE